MKAIVSLLFVTYIQYIILRDHIEQLYIQMCAAPFTADCCNESM